MYSGEKIFIRRNTIEIDVTGTRPIIWGCGKNVAKLCDVEQIDDIAYVIDGNADKVGNEVVLYSRKYVISSPRVLLDLDPEDYYIVISSRDYYREILKVISEDYPSWVDRTGFGWQIVHEYSSVDHVLIRDPHALRKLNISRISQRLFFYIDYAYSLIFSYCGDKYSIGKYRLNQDASRCVFSFENNTTGEKYIMHMPCRSIGRPGGVEFGLQKEIIEIKKRLKLDTEIVIYEDEMGFCISRLVDVPPYCSTEILERVFGLLKRLHDSNEIISRSSNIWEQIRRRKANKCRIDIEPQYNELIDSSVCEELSQYEPTLCHGDMGWQNVLEYHGRPIIIDYTEMHMGDRCFDICRLIFHIIEHCKHDSDLSLLKGLELYYGRKLNHDELRHAEAMYIAVVLDESLAHSIDSPAISDRYVCMLRELLDRWRDVYHCK